MGLIVGQVIGDLTCKGNLCHGIDASRMRQPLDCVGEGCACVKSTICATVTISLLRLPDMDASQQLWRVVPLGCDWPCQGAASETETQGGQLDERRTARTCEKLVLRICSRRLLAQTHRHAWSVGCDGELFFLAAHACTRTHTSAYMYILSLVCMETADP